MAGFRGLAHTFSQLITFSGGVRTNEVTKVDGSGLYVAEDGGTIWHNVTPWFTPTSGSTASSNGTTVTLTGSTQLTSAMVGAKIQIGTEKRIITAFVSSSVVTVNRAFSANLVGVSVWNVWNKAVIFDSNGVVRIFGYPCLGDG